MKKPWQTVTAAAEISEDEDVALEIYHHWTQLRP